MDSRRSDPNRGAAMPLAVKILVAGGFGVGKTSMVGAVSEIKPLRTEEQLTDRSVGVDDVSGVERKTTTTVAMDFGRITSCAPIRRVGLSAVIGSWKTMASVVPSI